MDDLVSGTTEDLIETVAYKLVERTFETYPIVQEIKLELKKPWAPIIYH